MGYKKYRIWFTRSGTCDYKFDRETDYFIKAIYWLIRLRFFKLAGCKYPQVYLEYRNDYIACEDCTADWCEKSAVFDKTV